MSENLDIRTRLLAVNEMSPVLRQVIADLKKFEGIAKRLNSSFAGIGQAGVESMAQFDRVARNAAAQMRGLGNVNRAAAHSFADDWQRAANQRVADMRRMYNSLERMEAAYMRQLGRSAGRVPSGVGRVGSAGRIPAPRISTLMLGGSAVAAGAAASIRKRMLVDAAETRAAMFGELSKSEILKLRSQTDKLGIKYGVGSAGAIDTAVEGLKAGIGKEFASQFAELALKSKAGIDLNEAGVAKLMGRLVTMNNGFDKGKLSSILNAIGVAANATAADGNEIVEAFRRSLSAMTATKMRPEELAAFDASAISIGIQPFKAGTFMSFITSELANAKNARGQRAQDLTKAANILGFGGRSNLSEQMIANPTETLLKVYGNLINLPEGIRAKVADLIGQREWRDELLSVASARDLIVKTLDEIANKKGFLDAASLKKIRSMTGRWASIQAAFGLAFEKIGAGFEAIFDQISDAVIGISDRFDFDSIKTHFAALIEGAREGFGLREWGEVVRSIAGQFDVGTTNRWRSFGKGFAEGIREFASGLKDTLKVLSSVFGGGKDDAEGLGKFAARLTGVAVTLSLLSPALSALALFSGIIATLAAMNPFTRLALGFAALATGIKSVLDLVADKIFRVFVSVVDAIKNVALSFINRVRGWIGLAPIGSGGDGASGSAQKQSFLGPAMEAGAAFQKASFNPAAGYSSIVNRGNIPAFNGGGGSSADMSRSAFDRKFAGTALSGKYDQIASAAKANGIPPSLLAGVIAHETGNGLVLSGNNVAGLMDPSTGMSRKQRFSSLDDGISAAARTVAKNYRISGGDLDKMGERYAPVGAANDPRGLNGGWSAGVRRQTSLLSGGGGSAGSGDAVGWARQFSGMNEYRDARILASALGADVRGRSNAWCARLVNKALESAGGKGTGSAVANSFQKWGNAIDPSDVKRNDVLLQTRGLGPNQTGGHVGLATGETRMNNGRLQIKMLAGNDGDSVREHWIDADRNLMVRRGNPIGEVPSPVDAVKNVPAVPPSTSPNDFRASLGRSSGPVAIHINGNSHDPEALATLVQRRIDESMNWRTHDTESEYT